MIRYQCLECHNTYDNEKPRICSCKNSKQWSTKWLGDKPTENDLTILEDPALLDKILSEVDQYIPFEREPKKAILYGIVGRFVRNKRPISFNLFINGVSGAGKDFLVNCMLKMCVPELNRKHFQEPSPKSLKYEGKEPEDWHQTILYIEDPSQGFLDSEYTKIFISSNEGTAISVDDSRKRIETTKNGKPTILMTSAETDLNIEGLRRWFIVPIIADEKKTKRILHLQARQDVVLFKTLNCLNCLNSLNCHIPFGEKMAESLPIDDVIILSVHERLRDFIKASAILHQYQRETNNKGEIIATKQDYEDVKKLFEYCLTNSIRPKTKKVGKLLEVIERSPKAKNCIKPKTAFDAAEWEESEYVILKDFLPLAAMSKTTAYKQLGRMVSSGFLVEGEVKDELNRSIKAWKVVSTSAFKLPDWDDSWNQDSLDNLESLENQDSLDNLESLDNSENLKNIVDSKK